MLSQKDIQNFIKSALDESLFDKFFDKQETEIQNTIDFLFNQIF